MKMTKTYIKCIRCALAALLFAFLPALISPVLATDANGDPIVVSLGDSYASGEGVEPFYGQYVTGSDGKMCASAESKVTNDDWLAHRSTKSWAGALKIPGLSGTLKDYKDTNWYFVASSGAESVHVRITEEGKEAQARQKKPYNYNGVQKTKKDADCPTLPSQLEILAELPANSVDYVTLSIGGNDMGFKDVIESATIKGYFSDNWLPDLMRQKWEKFLGSDGKGLIDGKADGIQGDVLQTYRDIATMSSCKNACILVTGYPKLFKTTSTSEIVGEYIGATVPTLVTGAVLFSDIDMMRINTAVTLFNNYLREMVTYLRVEEGISIYFVDIESAFEADGGDHGAYSDSPWINPVMLTQSEDLDQETMFSAYSMHPNESGIKAYTKAVQSVIDSLDAYRHFLTDNGIRLRLFGDSGSGDGCIDASHFTFADMDADSVPELIVYGLNGVTPAFAVYTYTNGSVRQIANSYDDCGISCPNDWNSFSLTLCDSKNLYIMEYPNGGHGEHMQLSYNGNSVKVQGDDIQMATFGELTLINAGQIVNGIPIEYAADYFKLSSGEHEHSAESTATPAPAVTSAPAVVVPSSGDGVLSINCAGVSLTFGEDYDSVKSKMDARCNQYFYLDSTEEASWDYKKLIYTYDNSDCGFTDITLYFFCWGEREEYYVLTDVRMNDYDNVRTDCSVAGVYLGMSQSDAAGRMSLYETDSHWTCYNLYAVNYGVSGGIAIDREISLQEALSGNYSKLVIARTGESNEQEQGHVGTLEVILFDYAEDHDLYLDYLDSVEEHTEPYSPEEEPTESYSPEETYSLSIGEIVTFGTYMQSSSGSIDELDWIVLDRDGDYYLLTTLYGIDAMNFDGSSYANSAVRSFLNNDFYYTAFTSSERSLIRTTHVSAESNPKYPNRDAGSSTDDKVFILSISEAEKYFPTDGDRQCYPTDYAISQGARTSSDCGTCYYWLTNPGSESKRHAVVDGTGIIWHKGQQSLEWGKRGCVRPCIWIKIG